MLAIAAMLWFADNFRTVFWLAVIPAFAAVLLLVVGVREPDRLPGKASRGSARDYSPTSAGCHRVTGGSSPSARRWRWRAFPKRSLVLRAQNVGMALAWVPLVMALMSVVYAIVSYPAGVAADQKRQGMLFVRRLFRADHRRCSTRPCVVIHGRRPGRHRGVGRTWA